MSLFEIILETRPSSPGALYGKARSLDKLSEVNKSNALLKRAIDFYLESIDLGAKLNDSRFKEVAERCIDRMRFLGKACGFDELRRIS